MASILYWCAQFVTIVQKSAQNQIEVSMSNSLTLYNNENQIVECSIHTEPYMCSGVPQPFYKPAGAFCMTFFFSPINKTHAKRI